MLKDFKDIIPQTVERATESTPVKKVSETGAGARLVLSFAGMLLSVGILIYVMIRWVPRRTYDDTLFQLRVERSLKKEAERERDSIQNIKYNESIKLAREIFEEWKASYIIVQDAHSVTIKPK